MKDFDYEEFGAQLAFQRDYPEHYKKEIESKNKELELISLSLWCIRRLPNVHKEFAYKELISIIGDNHEYLDDLKEEISRYI